MKLSFHFYFFENSLQSNICHGSAMVLNVAIKYFQARKLWLLGELLHLPHWLQQSVRRLLLSSYSCSFPPAGLKSYFFSSASHKTHNLELQLTRLCYFRGQCLFHFVVFLALIFISPRLVDLSMLKHFQQHPDSQSSHKFYLGGQTMLIFSKY